MKKYFWPVIILFCLACLVVRTYVHAGFPYTHDGENHLARFANYAIAVREGQFPPRFAPNLFNHYGYPVFDFNYPLANILSLPFSFLRINFEVTFKVITFSAVLLGLVGSWLWLTQLNVSKASKYFSVSLFAFSPYLFNLVLYRGNIGEVLACCLLPWLFWTIEKMSLERKEKFFFIVAVGIWAAFFLSHNTTAVFAVPLLVVYAAFRFQRNWKNFFFVFCAALLLSLWFWLPALMEKSLIILDDVSLNTEFFNHFPSFQQLLFAPLQFGFSYAGSIDSLSFSLGITQWVVLVLGGILFAKKSIEEKRVVVFEGGLFCTLLLLIIFQLPWTSPIWNVFSFISKYLQFPWRLTLFFAILIIPFAAKVFSLVSGKGKVLLFFFVLLQAIAFTRLVPVDYFHHSIEDYIFFSQSTSTQNENLPKTFTFSHIDQWEPKPIILQGTGDIQVTSWRGSNRKYSVTATTPVTIVEPTMYFAGWQTEDKTESNSQKISYVDSKEIGGRIAYTLPVGKHEIVTQFTQWTPARIIGNTVSLITALGIVIWFFWPKQKTKRYDNA